MVFFYKKELRDRFLNKFKSNSSVGIFGKCKKKKSGNRVELADRKLKIYKPNYFEDIVYENLNENK